MKYRAFLFIMLFLGYQVTKDGRVLNSAGKELKQNSRKGYPYVIIKRKKYSVHRLVALCYIPNSENKPEIDHIDGNPFNNNVNNLRWATRTENELNPITIQKLSKSLKGRIISEEARKKISISLTGKKQSEETKQKRANKLLGKKRPQYVIDILRKSNMKSITCIDKKTGKIYYFESQKDAANFAGISTSTICSYLKGKIKSKKYIWKRS